MEKKTSCVMCGSDSLRLDESARTVEIDGVATEVPFRMHWCESCGSEMGLNEDLRFNARAMRQARKKHYGLLTSEEVRKIRKQLGLNQDQAAKLFGGGPVAFSKYENDEITQSEAMDRLIWLIGTYPELATPLANRLKIVLPGQAKVVIEKHRAKFDEKYLAQARASGEAKLEAFKDFNAISTASNDRIYKPGEGSRPTKWKVA